MDVGAHDRKHDRTLKQEPHARGSSSLEETIITAHSLVDTRAIVPLRFRKRHYRVADLGRRTLLSAHSRRAAISSPAGLSLDLKNARMSPTKAWCHLGRQFQLLTQHSVKIGKFKQKIESGLSFDKAGACRAGHYRPSGEEDISVKDCEPGRPLTVSAAFLRAARNGDRGQIDSRFSPNSNSGKMSTRRQWR